MKNLLNTIFLIALFAFCGSTVSAQGFPWQDFKPRTLKDLAAMEKDVQGRTYDKPSAVFHCDMLLTRARVVYTGLTQLIDIYEYRLRQKFSAADLAKHLQSVGQVIEI